MVQDEPIDMAQNVWLVARIRYWLSAPCAAIAKGVESSAGRFWSAKDDFHLHNPLNGKRLLEVSRAFVRPCNGQVRSVGARFAMPYVTAADRFAAMFRCLAGAAGVLMPRTHGNLAVTVLAAATLAAGCIPTRPTIEAPEAPSVTVQSVRILGLSQAKANLSLTLGLANPNDFDLPLEAIACEVTLDGRPAASVRSVHMEPVPAHGEAKVELAGQVDVAVVATSLMTLGAQLPVSYTLKGTATLHNGVALPFSHKGDIPVARFDRAFGTHP